jgi:hypothetical protein
LGELLRTQQHGVQKAGAGEIESAIHVKSFPNRSLWRVKTAKQLIREIGAAVNAPRDLPIVVTEEPERNLIGLPRLG